MKKTFSVLLCILMTALLLLGSLPLPALAESAAFPINPLPVFGEIPTQWQLFTGDPVDYQLTLHIDEETGLRTYTIHNPLDWGIDAASTGTWAYTAEGGWQRTGDSSAQQVELALTDADYQEYGFPVWTAPCTGADELRLTAYLGQLRELYAYVDYFFGDDSISIYAQDHSFTISCAQQDEAQESLTTTYTSYDPSGILAYATYTQLPKDGSHTSYTVEAYPQSQSYQLASVSHSDAEGNSYYWQDGQWQNDLYEPVEAPAGISLDPLPLTITGGWQGTPFEEPGDKPTGSFSAPAMTADPALSAADYQPWPEAGSLHRTLTGPIPAFPAIDWATQEDGTCIFTVTGLDNWNLPTDAMGDWTYDPASYGWIRGAETTPGQLTLYCPAEEALSTLVWEHAANQPDASLTLSFSRATLSVDAVYLKNQQETDGWLLNNQGTAHIVYPLDDRRIVEAYYSVYTLLEYNIHTSDEQGNRLYQACYAPTEADETLFELGCFFRYSPENNYEESLWIRDIGWYSYETGAPCDAPEDVDLSEHLPLELR